MNTVRRWLKRALLALLLLAGLYLLAVNLFLNTLGPRAFTRRPERFSIDWTSAWTVLPGRVDVRGLQLSGGTRNVAWSVSVDRAKGRIDLPSLLDKTFRVSDLQGEGVHSRVRRGPGVGTPRSAPRPGRSRRTPWTLQFERISLDHVREFRFNDFRLSGDGPGEGAFSVTLGGDFRLEPSTIRMPAAQLAMGKDTLARDINLEAEASMGPYVVRRHPGLQSFDFLSGSLTARGKVADLPFFDRAPAARGGAGKPGVLAVDLQLQRGRLVTGSRLDVAAPAAGAGSPLVMTAAIESGPSGPALRIGIDAKEMSVGRTQDGSPLFRTRVLEMTSTTPETRLSRIFAAARDVRTGKSPSSMLLIGDVRAEGVEIKAPGSRASLRAKLDRATGRVDLAGLLARTISIAGLEANGVSARLELPQRSTPSPSPQKTNPWSVRIAGARLTGIREIGLGDFLLSGDAQAETTLFYDRDGVLAVERAAVAMPSGSFRVNGEPAAQSLALKIETRIEPSVLGNSRGAEFLRYVSGTGSLRGRISSLGFLDPYLEKTPWLAVQGQGWLSSEVKLDRGKLQPGSRLTVSASPARATILDSLATGKGTVNVAVESGKTGPLTTLRVRFEQFGLADPRQKGRPAYLRGRGLRIAAVVPHALDLTAPLPDFSASFDLPEAEVPDLAVYNILIPEETGLSLISGRGRVEMHLEASTATRGAKGNATLTSEAAAVQFQNLELQGKLALRTPLASSDLASRKFDLKGMRLEMDGVSYHDIETESPAEPMPWWLRARIDSGSVVWGAPLSLRGEGRIDMKNSGPLLTLFAQRSRFLRWFDDALNVENVTARGVLRLGDGAVEIESLQATGGPLEVQSRMIFTKDRKRGDLYVRYGRLAAGIELRDGQRSFKLRRALEWFEGRSQSWKSP